MTMLSIIMPIFNKEKYVRQSIQSILNQNYKNFELIIVNDGSTDKSLEICLEFQRQDQRVHVMTTNNGGVSKARNIGLDYAKGNYVLFIDSDDFVDPFYLSSFMNNMDDVVIGGLTKISQNGKILDKISPPYLGCVDINIVAHSFYHEQLETGIYGFVSSKMISLELINQYQIRFDESITLAEDFCFFLDIYSKVEKITFIDEKGYYYLQETENSALKTDDSKINFFQQINIQKKAKKFLISKNSFSEENEKKYLQLITGYVYTILLQSSCLDYKEYKYKFNLLKENVEIVDKECQGFMKFFIDLYDKNKYYLIFFLLKIKKVLVR